MEPTDLADAIDTLTSDQVSELNTLLLSKGYVANTSGPINPPPSGPPPITP